MSRSERFVRLPPRRSWPQHGRCDLAYEAGTEDLGRIINEIFNDSTATRTRCRGTPRSRKYSTQLSGPNSKSWMTRSLTGVGRVGRERTQISAAGTRGDARRPSCTEGSHSPLPTAGRLSLWRTFSSMTGEYVSRLGLGGLVTAPAALLDLQAHSLNHRGPAADAVHAIRIDRAVVLEYRDKPRAGVALLLRSLVPRPAAFLAGGGAAA